MNSAKVTFTDIEGNESFARSFGISEQREAEIDEVLEEAYQTTDSFPAALAMASEKLANVNEVAYASFHLGAFAESKRAKYDLLKKFMDL